MVAQHEGSWLPMGLACVGLCWRLKHGIFNPIGLQFGRTNPATCLVKDRAGAVFLESFAKQPWYS